MPRDYAAMTTDELSYLLATEVFHETQPTESIVRRSWPRPYAADWMLAATMRKARESGCSVGVKLTDYDERFSAFCHDDRAHSAFWKVVLHASPGRALAIAILKAKEASKEASDANP